MEKIIMSRREMEQVKVFESLKRAEISQAAAAALLKITARQVRNKLKRFKAKGPEGLIHKSRGRESKKRWASKEKAYALELLRSDWLGFGPTFAAEKLEELHKIKISPETLRKAMIEGGLWTAKAKRPKHRKRRDRRSLRGVMVQLDGSDHDWFEGRAQKCTLLVFIDDATSELLWLEFVKSESLKGCFTAMQNYLTCHGRPGSFYVDFGKVWRVNLNNPEHEKLTQFERAMKELDIEMIHAYSPQAKGRVERSNGTLQDRLIKEMRLASISTMDEANIFARDVYISRHNKKFAVEPHQEGDSHRSLEGFNLKKILCRKSLRILQNDFIIAYNTRLFQLTEHQKAVIRPKEAITVREGILGEIALSVRGIDLDFIEILNRPIKQKEEKIYGPPKRRPVPEASKNWASQGYAKSSYVQPSK